MQIQKNGYGCGLYAVANALKLENFVTEERLEQSKNGIGNGKLNQYLLEDGKNIFIDVLYCDTQVNSLPENWCSLYSEDIDKQLPILIQCVINGRFHLMGAILTNEEGKITLFDSLNTEPIVCTLSDINKMYDKVHALYSFNYIDTTEYYAMTNGI
jgi:Ulp1 family protease